jgi:pilus assembly protein CpaB
MIASAGWWMLGVSLSAGALATLLASAWLGEQRADNGLPVVVANRDISAGQMLDPALLDVVKWPRGAVPQGALADPALLVGRVPRTALVRGEPVLAAKLTPEGSRGGLAAVIAPGHRAITVRVNEVIGVAGFALPGNFVDVLVSAQDDSQGARMVSRIVLERILVLAIAQEATRDETRPKVVSAVTLQVTPQEAERLDLARNIGQLSLALRNQGDSISAAGRGVSRAELLGLNETKASPPVVSESRPPLLAPVRASHSTPAAERSTTGLPDLQVEVIRGLLKSTATFNLKEVALER